ncbi:hypothetical protein BO94DRAFT_558164 [Aspergillus sclerotioniger CBS 115572]|uniref:Xylanolytic transcriptional activator regulatory domain-containing protein n=1 Tax=Aspergillus sclerotioniger CBS 115572 TaxID=1450535 RepID=A0A317W2N7_9EURO|nr:hypothetical protein BO94DRAFT_558164 [Aspergillus sclerotioniger CBS 115572]PWY80733.1 hypothetical protein BO94DRAFT_558164 [Aspergillus sclerotioniger CBS 115572]
MPQARLSTTSSSIGMPMEGIVVHPPSSNQLHSLTEILGHTRFRDLIDGISCLTQSRLHGKGPYFEHVHPLYPFLDRSAFENKAFDTQVEDHLSNAPFSALYFTVLALGCLYVEGGSFDPGKGTAWKLFQHALGLFPEILQPPETLVNVQGIFAMNFSCIQISKTLTTEAARMVQCLGYSAAYTPGEDEKACHRVFWVIYWQERVECFFCSRAPIIADYDIGCPVPETPAATIGDLDWLMTTARLGRLISRMYECLFSVSAVRANLSTRIAAMNTISAELEQWKESLPKHFQLSQPFRPSHFKKPYAVNMAIQLRLIYYSLSISICRLRIHVSPNERNQGINLQLMEAARTIIYLSRYIDHEPHVPTWTLGIVPISALFIIFEFIIHNPRHAETSLNLAYLDMAVGYFSRWEVESKGTLPFSYVSEFAHIARQFVQDVQNRQDVVARRPEQTTIPWTEEPSRDSLAGQIPLHNPMDVLENGINATDMEFDELFYPSDPLQPIMGTSNPSASDFSALFDFSYWN